MEVKNDITNKEFLVRILSTIVVWFIVSVLIVNIFMPRVSGIIDTAGAAIGAWLFFSLMSSLLPAIWFFGSLMFGKRIRKKMVLNGVIICSGIYLAVIVIGGVYGIKNPL